MLQFERVFTVELGGRNPFDSVEWERRDAVIQGGNGKVVFEQKDVEVPKTWSQTATNIVASKYFHGILGTPERETSVRQVIERVAGTLTSWAVKDGYLALGSASNQIFYEELVYMLLHQYGAFNSPVWFNVGCDRYQPDYENWNWHWDYAERKVRYDNVGYSRPQCSACFINGVKDNMESIMDLAKTEVMLFKGGSGAGSNLSALRSTLEPLSGGGKASGPLSFMKGYDAFAGVIKSGGKTRRAAKMVILDIDHPDIEEFIVCKQKEEKKAYALMREGYDGSNPDAEAYSSIFYQNANNSVRVSDDFMKQLLEDPEAAWELKARGNGSVLKTVRARELMDNIAQATWECGDPGMQFHDTINAWHTCPDTSEIRASNPCSEYMFIDDSSCNLASLNLVKFYNPKIGRFNLRKYRHAVDVFITAQDILVDNAGYPTENIAKNSRDYRPLGLGYANLGALLMNMGYAYDSDEGREVAGCLTSLMTGEAYLQSARLAKAMEPIKPATQLCRDGFSTDVARGKPRTGAFPGYYVRDNARHMLNVISKHGHAAVGIPVTGALRFEGLREQAEAVWNEVGEVGDRFGFRNSQVTVLAPTGTIGFMLDCDTTGIEPVLGLVTFKKLVGGGQLKLTIDSAGAALLALGYSDTDAASFLDYIQEHGTVEGSGIKETHLAVFDCAFKSEKGTRTISWQGHVNMMAAVQPFLSGAISKTINMPEDATVADIQNAYMYAWKQGVKAVAIYRDGSKKAQPVVTKQEVNKRLGPVPPVDPELVKLLAGAAVLDPAGSKSSSDFLAIAKPVEKPVEAVDLNAPPKAVRHKLPDERPAINHKFNIAGHEGYLTVGLYANGQPGEIFITMSKEGSTLSGIMDAFATAVSVAWQHGVPLNTYVDKFAHMRFEPSGYTGHPEMRYAKSIMDYIFRWLDMRFLQPKQEKLFNNGEIGKLPTMQAPAPVQQALSDVMDFGDAPVCSTCGSIMVRNGSCYKCLECGGTSGCS